MSVGIIGHDIYEIEAESYSRSGINWVRFTAHTGGHGEVEVELFFRTPFAEEQVRIYAEAINEANKKIAALAVPNKAFDKTIDRVRDAMAAQS